MVNMASDFQGWAIVFLGNFSEIFVKPLGMSWLDQWHSILRAKDNVRVVHI